MTADSLGWAWMLTMLRWDWSDVLKSALRQSHRSFLGCAKMDAWKDGSVQREDSDATSPRI